MKQKFKNTQKGITLVALVITIIVLLILAMVSIRILMDGGLISKAKDATAQHTIGAEKEAITTGYGAYQIALANKKNVKQPTIEGAAKVTPKGEDWSVTFTKTNNEYELKKDGTITLTKQGNGSATTVGWKDNGNDTFTKGEVTVKVGDIVTYNVGEEKSTTVEVSKSGYDSDQTFKTEKNLGWRVLGINSKGEIELISDNPTSTDLYLQGELGYLNAEEVLNNMCNELYGKGVNSSGARSLNVEDVNKLIDTGYDPKTYSGYGNKWTYRFPTTEEVSGTRYLQYKTVGADGKIKQDWKNISSTSDSYQKFRMPGADASTTLSSSNPGTSEPLEYTCYYYTVSDKVKKTASDGKSIADIITKGKGTSNVNQWLASCCVVCNSYDAHFGVRNLYNVYVNGNYLYYSYGDSGYSYGYRLRPVVSLKSDIQLSGNSNDGWTIN